MQLDPKKITRSHLYLILFFIKLFCIIEFSYKKLKGYFELAFIPPTLAAAIKTIFGLYFLKNKLTLLSLTS